MVKRLYVALLAGCLAVLCLGGPSSSQDIGFSESASYSVNNADFEKVTSTHFEVIAVDSVSGLSGCQQILESRLGIVYLNDQGHVIASAMPEGMQRVTMSPDGSTIAKLSWAEENDRPLTLEIETIDGESIWTRDDGYGRGESAQSTVHVTQSGYVIITPNVPAPEFEDSPVLRGNIRSPLILDSNGQLVAELPVDTRRSNFFDALSPEGRFYGINFIDMAASGDVECHRGTSPYAGQNCLVLFEVETGKEVWRHYFGDCGFGRIAVGPEGRTVVSVGQDARMADNGDWNGQVVYIFDDRGNVLGKKQMVLAAYKLVLSQMGTFAATVSPGEILTTRTIRRQLSDKGPIETITVPVRYDSVFVFDILTGDLVYSAVPVPTYSGKVRSLDLAEDGSLLAVSTYIDEAPPYEYNVIAQLFDSTGEIIWERSRKPIEGRNVRYSLSSSASYIIEVQSTGTFVVNSRSGH